MNNNTTGQKELLTKEKIDLYANATGNVSPLKGNPDLSFKESIVEAKNIIEIDITDGIEVSPDEIMKRLSQQGIMFVNSNDEEMITLSIITELKRAESKHSWEGNSLVKMALILAEESGEVCRAVLQHDEENGSIEAIRTELIQTAAMCYRMLKNLPNE